MKANLTHRSRLLISDLCTYLLLTLFMYTAASKLLTIKKFASTLAKSPLIGEYSIFVAWAIPISEVLTGILLIIAVTRKMGLYASLAMMSVFTIYLSYMVLSGSKLPCHCGGVISSMTWQQHIWFNLAFVFLAFAGIRMYGKQPKNLHV